MQNVDYKQLVEGLGDAVVVCDAAGAITMAMHPNGEDRIETAARTGDETIFLIEDDSGVRQTVTHLLKSLGYTVIVASDGPEAIQLVRDGIRPDDSSNMSRDTFCPSPNSAM